MASLMTKSTEIRGKGHFATSPGKANIKSPKTHREN